MASLTVRQLDEALKKQLRLRAARNGRSVEDEVRTILRGAAAEIEIPAASSTSKSGTQFSRRAAPAVGTKRVLLIIGGGIAAYKSLDLIRRLTERRIAVRCILTKAAEHFVTPLSAGAIVGEHVFTDLFDQANEFDVGHIRLAREAGAGDESAHVGEKGDATQSRATGRRRRSAHRTQRRRDGGIR